MAFPLLPIITGIGSAIGAVFGFKGKQADVMAKALDVVGDATASNAQREQAIAQIITAEATSESWLTRMWRPLTMVLFVSLVVSYWFGYSPVNLNEPMSPTLKEIFELIKIGLIGYIPARTIDKVVTQINLSKILKTFIEKKLI